MDDIYSQIFLSLCRANVAHRSATETHIFIKTAMDQQITFGRVYWWEVMPSGDSDVIEIMFTTPVQPLSSNHLNFKKSLLTAENAVMYEVHGV